MMGTTMGSIHVYTGQRIINLNGSFRSFSDGWQTYISESLDSDYGVLLKLAKKISKDIDAPVLWFFESDSDYIEFNFYCGGKRVASYSGDGFTANKNLYQIPALIGYNEGHKRRLSKILSCTDTDFQVELLEEYFGVCLLPLTELLEEDSQALHRERGEHLYQQYIEEERRLTGPRAPVKVELVCEHKGKIFDDYFKAVPPVYKPHYFLFGYTDPSDNYYHRKLKPFCFRNGAMEWITDEEYEEAKKDESPGHKDDRQFHY